MKRWALIALFAAGCRFGPAEGPAEACAKMCEHMVAIGCEVVPRERCAAWCVQAAEAGAEAGDPLNVECMRDAPDCAALKDCR